MQPCLLIVAAYCQTLILPAESFQNRLGDWQRTRVILQFCH